MLKLCQPKNTAIIKSYGAFYFIVIIFKVTVSK